RPSLLGAICVLRSMPRTSLTKPPASTEVYTLSLHDALPISTAPCPTGVCRRASGRSCGRPVGSRGIGWWSWCSSVPPVVVVSLRSEEHTSELQSRENLVCRLLLEKKKTRNRSERMHQLTQHT